MWTVLASMMMFALVGAASPGPVNIIATSSGARFGYRRTLPHVVGASLAYSLVVLVSGIALTQAHYWLPQVTGGLSILGGLFLLYVAFKIASAPARSTDHSAIDRPVLLRDGALAQLLNPKAWLVALSGVSLFVVGYLPDTLYLWLFCLVSLGCCFVGVSLWALLGEQLGRYLTSTKRQLWFNRLMAALLASTVGLMWWEQL